MIIKNKKDVKQIFRLKECLECVEHHTNVGKCLGTVSGCKANPRPPKMKVARYELNFFDEAHNPKSSKELWDLLRAK